MSNTNTLTSAQLKTLRHMLEEERERLLAHFDTEQTEDGLRVMSETESVGELSAYDNHPGDLGTETFERERDLALDDHFRQKLAEVEAALGRLADGEYGQCAVCGETVPYERLEALPATTYCVAHAEHSLESGGGTDARPSISQMNADEERARQAARFDDAGAWERLEDYGNASGTVTTGNSQS